MFDLYYKTFISFFNIKECEISFNSIKIDQIFMHKVNKEDFKKYFYFYY